MTTIIIIFIGISAVVFPAVYLYNKLVACRFLVKEASSGIDIQLKRRHDLIPKIVDIVSGYAAYERSLLEKVTSMRAEFDTAGPMPDKLKKENELSGCLKNIFALSENYPDLKANENFLQLQITISGIEDDIQLARRYYNGTVRDYNILIGQFPSNILARIFAFKSETFFELEYATERRSPDVRFM